MLSAGKENVTMNNHQSGVSPTTFTTNSALASFYRVLSTNVDRKGKPFVSSIEGIKYPVFGYVLRAYAPWVRGCVYCSPQMPICILTSYYTYRDVSRMIQSTQWHPEKVRGEKKKRKKR